MDKTKKFVITINREYGSGGHAIGKELARRLGVKLIDKQILAAVAEHFNLTVEEAQQLEHRTPSWWDDFTHFYEGFMRMNEYTVDAHDITSRQLFYAQRKAMLEIAQEESCVVIGRCGFDIFKDHDNVMKLFVYSPLDKRIQRIVETQKVSAKKAEELIRDNDFTRQEYVKSFTGKSWYDLRNYDISLNVGELGVEGAVDFLMEKL